MFSSYILFFSLDARLKTEEKKFNLNSVTIKICFLLGKQKLAIHIIWIAEILPSLQLPLAGTFI